MRAYRKEHGTDQQHTGRIHAVLDRVATALNEGSPSNLEEPDAAIIACHFPELAKQVIAWDVVAEAVAVSKQALRNSVESELRDLHADDWPYEFESIRDGLCAITEARTAHLAASTEPFPPMIGPQSEKPIFTFHYDDAARFVLLAFNEATGVKGYLVHIQGDNYPGSGARKFDEEYGRPIYKFLIVMQAWNPTKVLNLKRHALDQLKADLERAVRTKQDRTYYRRVKGCLGCK